MIQLPIEVVKLLETAASHPEGHDALFEGHLESVAALYQVHPQTLEQLRECLEHPVGQAHATEILARPRQSPANAQPPASKTSPGVHALIARAAELPHGLELLTRGPIETAALQLGSHPFVVDEARLHLAARPAGERT